MIDQFNQLNQRIQLLRSTGDIVLQQINRLETRMNKRKQQNQYPIKRDIDLLNQLVIRLLQMLAEIKTCQYYQVIVERINIFSPRYIEMRNRLFENLIRQFINDLQIKRYKRLERLQCQSYQEIIGDPVHFEIKQ